MSKIVDCLEAMPERIARLLLLAQKIAENTQNFFDVKGPGNGDHATNKFMAELRAVAKKHFQRDMAEHVVCSGVSSRFDYYFREEQIVVEFALGLRNPQSEFERDVFKCLLAKDGGCPIGKLLFVSKPGGEVRLKSPYQRAVSDFVESRFGLDIEIWELVDTKVA